MSNEPAAVLAVPRVAPLSAARAGFAALFAATLAAAIAPFWCSALLPCQDAPQHLAAIRVLADYHSAAYGFEKWFVVDLARLQYLGFYLPAAALAKFAGPDMACRLLLSALAIATTAAFAFLLSTFGRDLRLAIFAPALFHTAPLYLGFFNFVESIPLALVVVSLAERQMRDARTSRAMVLAFAAAVLLWLHPSALAWALGACGLLALTSPFPRAVRRAALPLLPSVALLAAWAVKALASRDGEGRAAQAGLKWMGLELQVLELLRYGNVLAGRLDELCFALLAATWLALVLQRARGTAGEARPWRLPLLALATLCVYLVLPYDMGFMGFIHLRALPFLFFAAIASLPVAATRRSWALFAAAGALTTLYCAQICRTCRAFDREAQAVQLEQVLQRAERGRALTALIYEQGSHEMQFLSYLHFGAYYEVQRGGRSRYNFGETPWTPVRFRPETAPPPMVRGWELFPERFDPARDLAGDDYLLVRGPGPGPGPRFALVASAGRWQLYEARR